MRCPFGCRQAHRKESSIKRSVEYYRSKEGKVKKKALNELRGNSISQSNEDSNSTVVHDEVTLHYIQTLTGLIEGRWLSMEEVLAMLKNILRQHSMVKGKKFVYAFQCSRGGP
ncbi:MAG: hypothetical protein JXA79_11280 [Deltaproteobacteria bacterium]|nr:hypothetical protein [Deltaproteobacteria bacterium]